MKDRVRTAEPWHWAVVFLGSTALHLLFFIGIPHLSQDDAAAAGMGGIEVAVSLTASRSGAEADTQSPAPADAVQAPVPAEVTATEVTAPVEPVTVAPVERPVNRVTDTQTETALALAEPVAPVPETSVASPEIAPVAAEPPAVTPATATPAQPARNAPEPSRRPAARKPVAPVRMQPLPPKPAETVPPQPPTRPAQRVDETASQLDAQETTAVRPNDVSPDTDQLAKQDSPAGRKGSGPLQDSDRQLGSDTANLTGGGAVGNPSRDFMRQLRFWLDRHKTYPKQARRRRMQGIVYLHFRMTRDGAVVTSRIEKSSGHSALDREATEMLRRAQPLPRFTASMSGGYLDITVPVAFSLRGNN